MNPATVSWSRLNERILPKLDASWFGVSTPDLVDQARQLPVLRAWLWRALATGAGLGHVLTVSDHPGEDPQESFLLADATLDPLLLELGALAHASTIRTLVDRSSVLNLKQVLGDSLYARALRLRAMPGGSTPPADESTVLRAASTPLVDLREIVLRQGAREAVAWLKRHGDVANASLLILRCPSHWHPDRGSVTLSDAVIAVCWNDALARFRGESP